MALPHAARYRTGAEPTREVGYLLGIPFQDDSVNTHRLIHWLTPGAKLALVAGILLSTACTSRSPTMDTVAVKAFADRYTAAWNSRVPLNVAGFFETDGTLFVNGAPATGRAAIEGVARDFMTAFPDMELVMDDLEFGTETVMYHWTFIGTNTGPGGTGNAVRFSGYEEWTLGDDGLIAQSQGHFDNAEYQRQLQFGVAPGDG
jgi:uncharacterized protein (TIGR02246 family)